MSENRFVEKFFGLGSNRTKPGRETHQYPQGDGAKDCPKCFGRGVVVLPEEERPPFSVGEVTRSCVCTLRRDTLLNMERGWKNLTKVSPVKETPLAACLGKNVWVTANLHDLQRHVGRLAFDQGKTFSFKVITDVSLMSAWLYSANEVFDADVYLHKQSAELEDRYSRIEDLVESWGLLIIRLGVKTARNVAAPEVLLEALQIREMQGKATWIVDQPSYPLGPGHISYDARVGEFLELWEQILLSSDDNVRAGDTRPRQVNSAFAGGGKAFSLGGSQDPYLKATCSNGAAQPSRMPATAVGAVQQEEDSEDLLEGLDRADELARLFDQELEENGQRVAKKGRKGGRRR